MPIRLTQTVKILLVAYFIGFIIQQTGDQFFGTHLISWFGLVPASVTRDFRIWQFVTYPFIHDNVTHLFFNLLTLAFMGGDLEEAWGRVRFIRYYFFCAVSTGIIYYLSQVLLNGPGLNHPLVGSSGAVYGLLMAYGIVFGERILLFMMLFPMKAKHFVGVLALILLMSSVYSPGGAWASLAHLSGMGSGFIYLWALSKQLASQKNPQRSHSAQKRTRKKKSKHLKLIVSNAHESASRDEESEEAPKTWH